MAVYHYPPGTYHYPPPLEAIQMQILLDFTVKEFFDDLLVKYSENGNVEGVDDLFDRDDINIEARGYFEDNKQIKTEYTALLIASKNGRVGPAPGEIFVTFLRYFYVQLRMYILCRLVPETTYWLTLEIFLSTSDFKHGGHCT
jgi:hypothetical protein